MANDDLDSLIYIETPVFVTMTIILIMLAN